MYIEQLYTDCLAEAAYYIESNGEAAIIDPLREVDQYLQKAAERGATIKYIFETHFHADFVSGHIDLSRKTGASIIYGPTASTAFEIYTASDGEQFSLGNLTIEVMHTPGHTMESSVFLLKDEAGKDHAIFTGDTLFIGDVGRPDLAIKSGLTKQDLAGMLYDSLRNKILSLSDEVIVYPAHGAGSACGKNMSSETWSTLGEQRASNYALQKMTKQEFVEQVTTGIAPPPQYFPKNAMLNKSGYASIDEVIAKGMKPVSTQDVEKHLQNNSLVLDIRTEDEYQQGHIDGSIFIGLDGSYATWVGALIENLESEIILIAPVGREKEAITRLARVGYDNTIGYLDGGIATWKNEGKELKKIQQIGIEQFVNLHSDSDLVLDVRKPSEYENSHLENAISFPLDYIHENISDIDSEKTYYVHCKSGYRSMIAISILKQKGYQHLINIANGFDELEKTNLCTTGIGCTKTK